MLDSISTLFANIGISFVHFFQAITHPGDWLSWLGELGGLTTPEAKEALGRFIYYGGSSEFFFVVLTAFMVLTGFGIWRKSVMWGVVRGLEWFANSLGRVVAWIGLLMVLQQILIVFLQRIFSVGRIEFGPFAPFGVQLWPGSTFISNDISWWTEELKLYNAMIVCLCVTYTFVQGGHVRVDLIYARLGYRAKRVVDMAGALVFMVPVAVLTWLFAWYFMWRHLVTPKVSASDGLEQIMRKAGLLRWNVETISVSPTGFDAYYLFKVLMLAFCALVFLHAIAFFYRSLLEWREGEGEAGKYTDLDTSADTSATGTQ
jgi:TRAP-type mannitol/chloroaromatic compound transport system permease small subunit